MINYRLAIQFQGTIANNQRASFDDITALLRQYPHLYPGFETWTITEVHGNNVFGVKRGDETFSKVKCISFQPVDFDIEDSVLVGFYDANRQDPFIVAFGTAPAEEPVPPFIHGDWPLLYNGSRRGSFTNFSSTFSSGRRILDSFQFDSIPYRIRAWEGRVYAYWESDFQGYILGRVDYSVDYQLEFSLPAAWVSSTRYVVDYLIDPYPDSGHFVYALIADPNGSAGGRVMKLDPETLLEAWDPVPDMDTDLSGAGANCMWIDELYVYTIASYLDDDPESPRTLYVVQWSKETGEQGLKISLPKFRTKEAVQISYVPSLGTFDHIDHLTFWPPGEEPGYPLDPITPPFNDPAQLYPFLDPEGDEFFGVYPETPVFSRDPLFDPGLLFYGCFQSGDRVIIGCQNAEVLYGFNTVGQRVWQVDGWNGGEAVQKLFSPIALTSDGYLVVRTRELTLTEASWSNAEIGELTPPDPPWTIYIEWEEDVTHVPVETRVVTKSLLFIEFYDLESGNLVTQIEAFEDKIFSPIYLPTGQYQQAAPWVLGLTDDIDGNGYQDNFEWTFPEGGGENLDYPSPIAFASPISPQITRTGDYFLGLAGVRTDNGTITTSDRDVPFDIGVLVSEGGDVTFQKSYLGHAPDSSFNFYAWLTRFKWEAVEHTTERSWPPLFDSLRCYLSYDEQYFLFPPNLQSQRVIEEAKFVWGSEFGAYEDVTLPEAYDRTKFWWIFAYDRTFEEAWRHPIDVSGKDLNQGYGCSNIVSTPDGNSHLYYWAGGTAWIRTINSATGDLVAEQQVFRDSTNHTTGEGHAPSVYGYRQGSAGVQTDIFVLAGGISIIREGPFIKAYTDVEE